MITITQGVLTFKRFAITQLDLSNQMSYIFGLLFFGNLLDNMQNIKMVYLSFQIVTAIGWFGVGMITQVYESKDDDTPDPVINQLKGNFI